MTYLPAYDDNNGWEPTSGAGGAEPGVQPKTLWYMQDALGSTLGLVEKDGRVSSRYHYANSACRRTRRSSILTGRGRITCSVTRDWVMILPAAIRMPERVTTSLRSAGL
ncbi:hypothetical protein [Paenibacillus durus]|uniref:hypothetical protein n=1 Tax=Paenibacillus durus TaxID=44251 RepID=UPI001395EBB8|nr:hypothetical protein [Paenibacillus durus]